MRLIDADALGIGIATPEVFDNKAYAEGWNSVIKILEEAPIIEAEPVRHGRWIDHPKDHCSLFNGWNCSECMQIISGGRGKYCPNCGAKMDGGAEGA